MQKLQKYLGVTLLEIMLVLAVAAMIIIMSVKFYQSATNNQQTNGALSMIQGITAAADSLAQGTGSYAAITTATVQNLMPNNSMTAPWGGAITLSAAATNTYTVTMAGTPTAVCFQLKSRLAGNTKYTGVAANTCAAVGNFSYTYNSQS